MVQISTLLSIVASVSAASATANHPSTGALVGRDAQQGGVAEIYRSLLVSRSELQVRDNIVEVPEQDLQDILNKLAELQDDVEGLLAKAGKSDGSAVEVNGDGKAQEKAKAESLGGDPGKQTASKPKGAIPGLKNTNKEGGPSGDALKNLKLMGELDEAGESSMGNTDTSGSKSSEGNVPSSSNDKSEAEQDEEDDTTSTITLTSTSTKRVTVTSANMQTVTASAESQATDGLDADEADESEDEPEDDEADIAPLVKVAVEDSPEGEEVNSKAVLESAHIPPASTETPAPEQEDDAGSDTEDDDELALPSGADPKVKAVDTSSETGSQPRQTSTSTSTVTGDAPPAAVTDTAPSSEPSVPETSSTFATAPEEIATPAPGSSSSTTNGAAPLIDINLKNVVSSTTDSPDKPAQVSSSPTSGSDAKTEAEEETDKETTVIVTESEDAKSSEPDAAMVELPSDTGSEAEVTPGKQTSTGFKTLIRV